MSLLCTKIFGFICRLRKIAWATPIITKLRFVKVLEIPHLSFNNSIIKNNIKLYILQIPVYTKHCTLIVCTINKS